MEDRLWIEDVVAAFSFVTNLDLTWLVLWIFTWWLLEGMHFQPFPSARNEGESKGGVESEGLKHQFSQVENNLNLLEMLKLIPISKKTLRKKRQGW
jgi:hypothetical protein